MSQDAGEVGAVNRGVSVVIATRGRSQLLRRAISSIIGQLTEANVELVVVFDQVDIDKLGDVVLPEGRTLRVLRNHRSPGLAGARNTGIEAASHDLVAFCDDDDEWAPEKLEKQMELLCVDPGAVLVATGIRIETASGVHTRLSPRRTELKDLLDSRITELHPSSFLLRRASLVGDLGLIDERIPASYGEDYDLLLRAAKLGHVAAVPQPLTIVHWDRTSFFSDRWQGIADGLTYLLHKHPELARSAVGSSRIQGQIAFAHAALGRRDLAHAWAIQSLRRSRRQLRAYAAWLISVHLLSPAAFVSLLNRLGRGL